jgi:LPXTG-motif cell wall-anchored protein
MGFLDDITDVVSLPVTIPLGLAEKAGNTGIDLFSKAAKAPANILASNADALSGAVGNGAAVIGAGAGSALGSVGQGAGVGLGGIGAGVGTGLAGAIKPLGLGNIPSPIPTTGSSDNTMLYAGMATGTVIFLGLAGIIIMKKKQKR